MEFKTSGQLESERAAKVYADFAHRPLTQIERLERWREALDQQPSRLLNTLFETERKEDDERIRERSANSPISVAFEDPVLRAQGLSDDSYGEAKRFFGLTDWQLHRIVCYCHHGWQATSQTIARQVRAVQTSIQESASFLGM